MFEIKLHANKVLMSFIKKQLNYNVYQSLALFNFFRLRLFFTHGLAVMPASFVENIVKSSCFVSRIHYASVIRTDAGKALVLRRRMRGGTRY